VAQVVNILPVTAKGRVRFRASYCKIVMDKVALG